MCTGWHETPCEGGTVISIRVYAKHNTYSEQAFDSEQKQHLKWIIATIEIS